MTEVWLLWQTDPDDEDGAYETLEGVYASERSARIRVDEHVYPLSDQKGIPVTLFLDGPVIVRGHRD